MIHNANIAIMPGYADTEAREQCLIHNHFLIPGMSFISDAAAIPSA